ncbi:uncharacterized protein [Aegilops tauschii subsp. strangulata]|uniref:uncharacterized protein isoform X2 n=1 Tax=Triticum aestivum TaxID=4565 RepID=UPI001D0124F5|nr:uncharacterized protein LOC123121873 isoform X2 [Triticum aestivum]
MKLAYGLVFLGFLQSVAYQMFDQQVQALFEVKMVLNDSRGVLEDWNRYIDTACSTIATVMCDPDGNVVEMDIGIAVHLEESVPNLRRNNAMLMIGDGLTPTKD